jgi:hypothetical protein
MAARPGAPGALRIVGCTPGNQEYHVLLLIHWKHLETWWFTDEGYYPASFFVETPSTVIEPVHVLVERGRIHPWMINSERSECGALYVTFNM